MAKELYKRVSPHLQRVLVDGGTTTSNMNDLLLLQRSNEQYKDYLKLSFCPELHGYKKDTRSNVDYITKGYSTNSIQQELGPNLVVNGDFNNGTTGWAPSQYISVVNGELVFTSYGNFTTASQTITNLVIGKQYLFIGSLRKGTSPSSANMDIAGVSGTALVNTTTIMKSFSKIFTATNTSHTINLYVGGNESGTTLIYDNISLQEVLSNDLTQTSSANQPYLDKIAPNEKLSAKNPNGGSNYLTHPTIGFGASDEWTLETTLLINDSGNTAYQTILGNNDDISDVFINSSKDVYLKFNNNYYTLFNIKRYIGKSIIITLCKKNNYIYSYVNGELISTNTITIASFTISNLGRKSVDYLRGNFFSYHIFSKALSASEVAERSAILRSIFPEIPFTRIGDQIWSVRNFEATVTPQGNTIPEMQASSNVEKITNQADIEFSSDTVIWNTGAGITISGGVCHFNTSSLYVSLSINTINFIPSKYYKITLTVSNYSTGKFSIKMGTGTDYQIQANGTYTVYIKAVNGYFELISTATNTILDVDNISIQEVGWSDSQNLYDYVYANTSGTTEQKTYAAVKASAMWCHYNNDSALGAVYGKLYNWFAVKLLQMDIDYYNANNPTTPWGWRVPTQSDFNTLATTLGGAAVAGGKMKTVGTTYWGSPNTGATNESGFSAIGSGRREKDGSFNGYYLKNMFRLRGLDINYNLESYSSVFSIAGIEHGYGYSLRLIKA